MTSLTGRPLGNGSQISSCTYDALYLAGGSEPQEAKALPIEGEVGGAGDGATSLQGLQAPVVEVVDGVAHGLPVAAQVPPAVLCRRIWTRRRTEAWGERAPSSKAWRSRSMTSLTKTGIYVPGAERKLAGTANLHWAALTRLC